jgi:hypothetical protein
MASRQLVSIREDSVFLSVLFFGQHETDCYRPLYEMSCQSWSHRHGAGGDLNPQRLE